MKTKADLQSSIEKLKCDIEDISLIARKNNVKYLALESDKKQNLVEKELLTLQIQQFQEELEECYLQSQKYKSKLDDMTTRAALRRCNTHSNNSGMISDGNTHSNSLKLMQLNDIFSSVSAINTREL